MKMLAMRSSNGLVTQAFKSSVNYCKLTMSGSLHQRKERLGRKYLATDGRVYKVFRETYSDVRYEGNEVCLIVGFRLSLIGSNRLFHWLFQRLSLFDTPVWVGFPGFKTKFWMVEPQTNDYLGMYQYQGKDYAESYAAYICAVLKFFSVKGSVWSEITEEDFETYIKSHQH